MRPAYLDAVVPVVRGALVSALLIAFDITEEFFELARAHDDWELDEIALSVLVVFNGVLAIFSLRRWREAVGLLREATTDSLTGLANRRKGDEVLEREAQRAERYRRPLSVILFDLDHFKAVNDRYGHEVGDRVLQAVARAVSEDLRNTDLVTRRGGEEFLVICAETPLDGAGRLAERLRQAIARLTLRSLGSVTASFGVAQHRGNEGGGQPRRTRRQPAVRSEGTGTQPACGGRVRTASAALAA